MDFVQRRALRPLNSRHAFLEMLRGLVHEFTQRRPETQNVKRAAIISRFTFYCPQNQLC